MLDITSKGTTLVIQTKDKKEIVFDIVSSDVLLDGFNVRFAGEYEKSDILLEVKEYEEILIYKFHIEGYVFVILPTEGFDKIEPVLPFFGDVDILVLRGTKNSVKLYENIEAKIVIPYGEEKAIFLNTLGQHKEEVDMYRVKGEIAGDTTEFVFLK